MYIISFGIMKKNICKMVYGGSTVQKPKIFISSTIYDFLDLRSSLKYWLSELGFSVQLSEYSDFEKDSSQNSYQACLNTISECDYFILLIGSRVGGMFDTSTSITRKEYQTAYKLWKEGKIKKILTFVRQNVWDALEDRKSLKDLLEKLTVLENGKQIDNSKVYMYNSKILNNAEHIKSFIDEVRRIQEIKNGDTPKCNWVNIFNDFEDIINVLKVEIKITSDLSIRIAEENIKQAVASNLSQITNITEEGKICAYSLGFRKIHEELKKVFEVNRPIKQDLMVYLTLDEVHVSSDFMLFYDIGVSELETFQIEEAISSGVFLSYDKNKECYFQNNFCRALHEMSYEIKRLKKFVEEYPLETSQRILNEIHGYGRIEKKEFVFRFYDLARLNSIYERLQNIIFLSNFIFDYIKRHDNLENYPKLLTGFVEKEKPTDEEILDLYFDS